MTSALTVNKQDKPGRIPIFRTGQALQSLRDSGHSLPTALAEVGDNSIEAKSNAVQFRLEEGINKNRKKCINRIAVADNGEGMDLFTLHHYLEIGFSTRWMREDTIGKYGVGAKFAALNFARRIDCWSRQRAKEPWRHVWFDLDEALKLEDEGVEIGIDPPEETEFPPEFENLNPGEKGTLVVWSNVDRLEEGRIAANFDDLLLEVQKELSRIFRYFIDGGISFSVNGTRLLAIDPLFLLEGTWADKVLGEQAARVEGNSLPKKGLNHFPAIPIADEPIKIKNSRARLRVTLYPREVTRKRGLGRDKLAIKLRVPDNQGRISFVRMNREVAYTNVPHSFGRAIEDPDRMIGIEVSFNPELDDFFGIRNVKRGVEPHGELRVKLRNLLKRHTVTARKLLDEAWGQIARESKDTDGENTEIVKEVQHADKTMPKGQASGPSTEEEADQILEDLAKDTGHAESEEEKKAYIESIKALPFVLESVDFPGNMFLDIKHLSGKVIIRVNTRHRFYRETWEPLRKIAQSGAGSISGEEAVQTARRASEALALMVFAYGKAQSMHEEPGIYDDLTQYWGQFLDTLMGKIKDVL